MSKKILGLVTVFAVIMIMSLSSFAVSYSHGFSNHKETCSVTVSGSDTYNAIVKAKVYIGNNVLLDSQQASCTNLSNGTLSTSAYSANATKGKWSVDCRSNQHSNVVVTGSGTDT